MSTNDAATLPQAAHALKLIGDQRPSVAQMETVNLLLPALIQGIMRGKLTDLAHFRKANGLGIFSVAAPPIQIHGDAAFRVNDRFVKNHNVPMASPNDNWLAWFGDMEVPATFGCDVEVNVLGVSSLDQSIIDEIGDDVCDTNPAILWSMMYFGRLWKDRCYIFYMKDNEYLRRVVRVSWCRDGWFVYASATSTMSVWDAGCHAVSLKRMVAV